MDIRGFLCFEIALRNRTAKRIGNLSSHRQQKEDGFALT